MSSVAGGFAYFIPAAQTALEATGQVIHVTPSPSLLFHTNSIDCAFGQPGDRRFHGAAAWLG